MGNMGRWIVASIGFATLALAETPPPRTVVTLGFDDGRDSQLAALPLLAAHGMHASFFVISGNIGAPGYLGYDGLAQIQAAGHEFGGHTVDHEVLTGMDRDEVYHQACDDRAALEAAGLRPLRSFAYPGGATDPEVGAIVASCGYLYGWAQVGIDHEDCTENCTFAEAAEPADLLRIRSPLSVDKDWTLEDLQGFVLRAETTGGWLGLVFHHVCDDCNYRYRISPALLAEFLAWLAPRAANGTVVLPLSEAFAPASPADDPPAPPETPTAVPSDAGTPPARDQSKPSSSGCSSAGSPAQRTFPVLALLAFLWAGARLETRPRDRPGLGPGDSGIRASREKRPF